MAKERSVAVVGATGAVGQEMLRVLEQRKFPVSRIRLLASERSAGMRLKFRGEELPVEVLKNEAFGGVEVALFSAGAARSIEFAPKAVEQGAVVVDNSSAFRMDEKVPLVVPEVNPQRIREHQGIIANPNCSTIQMVVALKPLHDAARITRVIVSTYQSVSGAGGTAMQELKEQTRAVLLEGRPTPPKKFVHQIAFNLIPQIDVFLENGYTKEELKMIQETRKILEIPNLKITATCVRVPVFISHSESVNVQTERKLSAQQAREILSRAPGVKVVDDLKQLKYPMPVDAAGRDEVLVGRIREDDSVENGLNLWVVGDNLRKGAALNAVQIAELL